MTPPTPAAVRASLSTSWTSLTDEEQAALREDARMSRDILRVHIRAVAADLRSQAKICEEQDGSYLEPTMLRAFADKLEGKQ